MKRTEKMTDLQNQRHAAIESADALLAAGKNESLTPAETAEIDQKLALVDDLGNQISALAEQDSQMAAAAARLDAQRKAPIDAAIASIVNRGSGMSGMPPGQTKERWTIPATARRHSKVTAFIDDHNVSSGGYTAEEKAYRFGQYALAKASIDMPGTYRFENSTKFCRENGIMNASHLEGAGDSTGSGLFVPEEFGTDLIRLREEFGVARQLCKVVPMSSDTRTDPRWSSGLTAYFTGEGSAATSSTLVHDQVRLTAKKMTVLSTYSSELSEDAVIDFGSTLASEMAYASALKEDQCLIDGDGTSTYGHIRGLKSQFATTTIGTAPGYRDATGTTWGAMVIADITTLISVVPVYAQQGMKFLCSSQFYYQVMVPLLNAAGGVTGTELQEGFRRPMFQGIPVMFSQVMPIATATSGIMVMLGRFDLSTSFGDRRKMTLEFSKEAYVDSVSLFTNDLIAVKSSQRMDINVHSIGSNTVAGPIVALATA